MASTMRRGRSCRQHTFGAVALLILVQGAAGCSSARTSSSGADSQQLTEAIERLDRPTAGDMAALYDLRVARSGGLRLSMITVGRAGRLTISEPFGSAVSLTAWEADSPTVFFDMDKGCRREVRDLEDILGVGALPLEHAARLLGGRLPTTDRGQAQPIGDGMVEVVEDEFVATVRLASDPWRVEEVWVNQDARGKGWHLDLSSHASSVPGTIRIENPDGRWAELVLKRLEWPTGATLPDLPNFPPCGG
jgi:hypothetical protein